MPRTEARLVDALGLVLKTEVIATQAGKLRHEFIMSSLAPGIYHLVVETPFGSAGVRLVKVQ